MEWTDYLRFAFSLLAVVGLILGCAWAAKRFGFINGLIPGVAKRKRLSVIESIPLDVKRRLMILRCDNAEYLVIAGPSGETVIEKNITPPKTPSAAKTAKRPLWREPHLSRQSIRVVSERPH